MVSRLGNVIEVRPLKLPWRRLVEQQRVGTGLRTSGQGRQPVQVEGIWTDRRRKSGPPEGSGSGLEFLRRHARPLRNRPRLGLASMPSPDRHRETRRCNPPRHRRFNPCSSIHLPLPRLARKERDSHDGEIPVRCQATVTAWSKGRRKRLSRREVANDDEPPEYRVMRLEP